MGSQELQQAIDSCKYLMLVSIKVDQDQLRLTLREAGPGIKRSARTGAAIIEPKDRFFGLTWEKYFIYAVTNDFVDLQKQGKSISGRNLQTYSESQFLDYAKQSTFTRPELPGPIQHFRVVCLDQAIDIASNQSPEIRMVKDV